MNTLRQRIVTLETSEAEREQVEQAGVGQIERAKQEWEVTADSLPQLICLLNEAGDIIRTNRTVERWGLASVIKVRGKKIYQLMHPDQPDGYLQSFLQEAWPGLTEGQSANLEIEDPYLKRHLHIQIRPISTQTGRQSKATESFAVLIIDDITERKQAERLKNEFLANISQELQTPLTSIIGYCQMMLTGIEGELTPTVLENIRAIHENGQQLGTLIDEILDVTEIETGNLKLVREEISLRPLLEQIKTNYDTILTKAITIEVAVDPTLPPIHADKMRLRQILNHLMTNAVNFTSEGQIMLKAFHQNGWVCLEVKGHRYGH